MGDSDSNSRQGSCRETGRSGRRDREMEIGAQPTKACQNPLPTEPTTLRNSLCKKAVPSQRAKGFELIII